VIPRDFVTEWRREAPWVQDAHVEQDLVISRAIVEIFGDETLGRSLSFRGGTALHKLFLLPPVRFSEDIDLVQTEAGRGVPLFDRLRAQLDPWLGKPTRKVKEGRVNLVYRFGSEDRPPVPLRLKIEINSAERFTELGYRRVPCAVRSRWFDGAVEVNTFALDELLGTKMRALYQRSKGRDLFDLWYALSRGGVNPDAVVACFGRYMREGGLIVSRAQFEGNLAAKREDREFRADMGPLLRPGTEWASEAAFDLVASTLVSRLPGEPWKDRPREGGPR